MANTPKTNNPDLLAGSSPVPHQGTIRRKTSTQHGSGNIGVQFLWNREDPALIRPDMARIAALGNHAAVLLGPFTAVGIDHDVRTVRLVLVLALLALSARERLSTHADTLTFFDQRHLGSHADGRA